MKDFQNQYDAFMPVRSILVRDLGYRHEPPPAWLADWEEALARTIFRQKESR